MRRAYQNLAEPPLWLQYVTIMLLVTATALFRYVIRSAAGDNAMLVLFTFPIAYAAMVYGFGPGIFATILSLVTGVLAFVPHALTGGFDASTKIYIGAFTAVWLFVTLLSERLRATHAAYRTAVFDRDAQRDRLVSTLENIPDACYAVDENWNIIHANKALRDLSRVGDIDFSGKNLWEIFSDPTGDEIKSKLMSSMKTKQLLVVEVEDPTTGSWFQVRAFPEDYGMFVYVANVSDRVALDLQKDRLLSIERYARSEVEKASKLKDEFVATLSHELRTPLTSILGWAEVLGKRAGDNPRVMEGVGAIDRSTRLLTQLIDELLDMSRISAGKVRLEMEVVDLREIVSQSSETCKPAADDKGLAIKVSLPEDAALVRGDAERLHQIVNNILSNAVKFTPNGGLINLRLHSDGTTAFISVQDTGEGIDNAFLPFVFDRFRQASASNTRAHGGLGLGLALVRQLVELHGGNVRAESDGPGKGSVFVVELPVTVARSMGHVGNEPQDETPVDLVGMKILVVEDDDATREVLKVVLSDAGCVVQASHCAEDALALFEDFRPDVLLSDIGMPKMDGYQFISKVRQLSAERGGKVPAIAVTAFAQEKDRLLALDRGYQAHLAKPIESSTLMRAIHRVASCASDGALLNGSRS